MSFAVCRSAACAEKPGEPICWAILVQIYSRIFTSLSSSLVWCIHDFTPCYNNLYYNTLIYAHSYQIHLNIKHIQSGLYDVYGTLHHMLVDFISSYVQIFGFISISKHGNTLQTFVDARWHLRRPIKFQPVHLSPWSPISCRVYWKHHTHHTDILKTYLLLLKWIS